MNPHKTILQRPKVKPVVIIGMHRSGTSFLSRALSQCGLFLGDDMQGNDESVLFMLTNNNIFTHCYATWNRPFSTHLALQNEQVINSMGQSAVEFLESNSRSYLGSKAIKNFSGISFPWGWKDPRNTFTLPVWNRVFPGLKIIHIVRHGVDVANSLYQRDTAGNNTQQEYWPALSVKKDSSGLYHARSSRTLEQAFMLWEEYVEKAAEQVAAHGRNAIQLKYEDLLQDPGPSLDRVLDFCGLADSPPPPELLGTINTGRAYSYRQHPELVEFADQWKDTLARFGY